MSCYGKNISGLSRLLTLCLILFLGFLQWQPMALAQDRLAPVKEISVAVGQDYAPFYFRDQKGVADGWLVDIWRLWSQKSGIKVKFVMTPFGETLKLTKEGKVNVQGGCFYSEKRATYLEYVAPLANCDTHFFFNKNVYGIETLKDLVGFRIGVIEGDFAVGYLQKHLPGASLAQYATNDALFQALEKGEIRVFVMDTPVGLYFLEKKKLLSSFRYYPGRPLYSNAYRAAVKKGDTVLPPLIKEGLAMISSKEKAQIERRWVGSTQTKAEGVITIACDRYFPPFTMLTPSGRAAGILIDLWRLWSTKNIRRIEFIFGDWEDTIRMVKEGKADIHSGLYKTREREEFLSFSTPIFAAQNNLAFSTRENPLTLNALSNERVGVIAGSGQETQLRDNYPEIILSTYAGYRDLLYALRDGEILAAYDVGVSLQRVIEEMGLQGEIMVVWEPTPFRDLFAGVLKKNASSLKGINLGLSEITDREMRDVEARWVSNPDLRLFSGKARPLVLTPEEKEWLKAHSQIRLGVDPDFMPFEAVSQDGAYEGIAASYVSLLNEKLGVNMSPVKGLSWQQVMDAARAGEVDVLPCVVMTKQRSEFLQFTQPYLDFQTVIVTLKDAPFIADLKGLKDAKVAVVKDYYVNELLERDFPEITLVLVNNIEAGLRAVADGTAAAYVDNSASIIYSIRRLGLSDLKVAATTQYDSSLRFGIRKDWPQLANILKKALRSISEKEREIIANQWINVRFSKRTDWGFVLKGSIAALAIIGLILTIFLFWNRRLSREVGERKRAEERFQTMAATLPGAIIQTRVHADGRPEHLYLSAKAEEFFGMPPDQVIQQKSLLPWHPEDQERIQQEVSAVASTEKELNLVGRIQVPGGDIKWIRTNASPSRSPEGELTYNGFILDITERKLAELEYLKSERKVKAMSQAAEDALVMIDGKGEVLFWNPAAERLFGFSEEEAMGMDFHTMAAPDKYHDKIRSGLKRFASTGEGAVLGTTTEITARNRKGHEFPVEVTLSSFQVDDEWFAVGTVRDITERKRAEEALRESQKQFRTIADYTYDWEGWHDAEGKLLWVNPAVERISGFTVEECMEMPDYPLPLMHPKDHHVWKESLAQAVKGLPGNDVPFRVARKDGREVWVAASWNPVFDEARTFTGFRTSARDFTDRKLAEEAMKKSEKQVKTILETANEGFWFIDNNLETVEANPTMCRILGRERDDIIGKNIFDFVDEENKEIFLNQTGLRKEGITSAYEIALSRSDGSHVICLFNATPYFDENNEKMGAFAMVTDITDRKLAEDRLRFTQTSVDKAALPVLWVDPETGMFAYANEAACNLLGYSREELMDMRVPQIDVAFNEEKFSELMEALQAHSQIETEGIQRTKDGRLVNVFLSIVLTRLENRQIITVVARDETEKKQAEEAMKQSEERTRLILNSAGDGIFGVDTEGHVIFVNPGALTMLGFEEEELLGKKIHALIHHTRADGAEYPVEACPMYASYHAGAEDFIDDEVLWRNDGTSFPVEYNAKPIFQDGEVMGAVVTFRDITERLKSQQELKERLEELEQFNRLVVGRELKMIGLKEEVNHLLEQLGQAEKYEIVQ